MVDSTVIDELQIDTSLGGEASPSSSLTAPIGDGYIENNCGFSVESIINRLEYDPLDIDINDLEPSLPSSIGSVPSQNDILDCNGYLPNEYSMHPP